jgi:hypothetical protein
MTKPHPQLLLLLLQTALYPLLLSSIINISPWMHQKSLSIQIMCNEYPTLYPKPLTTNHTPPLSSSRPEDMTPEYQQLISREISLFRDRAAQKDKAKREREEERRRQIEVTNTTPPRIKFVFTLIFCSSSPFLLEINSARENEFLEHQVEQVILIIVGVDQTMIVVATSQMLVVWMTCLADLRPLPLHLILKKRREARRDGNAN